MTEKNTNQLSDELLEDVTGGLVNHRLILGIQQEGADSSSLASSAESAASSSTLGASATAANVMAANTTLNAAATAAATSTARQIY